MRLRVSGLACALAVLGSVIAAGIANASPQQNSGLTIAAAPNPGTAGEGVLVYGQLAGPNNGGQTIRLFHHVSGTPQGYTQISTTTTDPAGAYQFSLPNDLIYTNRNWYVRGPSGTNSRTIYEGVQPLVSMSVSTNSTNTNRAVVFTGHVTPNHRFEQVYLQQEIGSSGDWKTLRSTTLDRGSNYAMTWRYRRPGDHQDRVMFKGDNRNVFGASDAQTIAVQQAQVPGFSISTSAPFISSGGSATISGTLDQPNSSQPDSGAIVQLWGASPGHPFKALADKPTGSDGSYSFTESNLTTNTVYEVQTMTGGRHTALLWEGVRDLVTMTTPSTSATSGQTVTFSGNVQPNKAGRVIDLQTIGQDGDWHTVEIVFIQPNSSFQFAWVLGAPGTNKFRARITNDVNNVGSASTPVTITTTPAPAGTAPSS